MANGNTRIPKTGDHVYAGKNAEFVVVEVHHTPKVVDLRPLKNGKEVGPIDKGIPWSSLRYVDEAVNQAAARNVRQATEKK